MARRRSREGVVPGAVRRLAPAIELDDQLLVDALLAILAARQRENGAGEIGRVEAQPLGHTPLAQLATLNERLEVGAAAALGANRHNLADAHRERRDICFAAI